MTQLHYYGLLELARMIRAGEVSPVTVTQELLQRIDAVDARLRSYSSVFADSAIVQARRAEAELAENGAIGLLHGVPIAIKDNIWVEGAVCGNGMSIHADFRPEMDAVVVRRLREAGAIILGKLQQTEGAFIEHHPSVEPPVNPWSADIWSGVSSSGSAVATAAGLCFGALATDTGGSIRVPCDVNGVTGIKPTYGLIPRHGIFENSPTLDHVGVIGRKAEDVAAILQIMAGHDPLDPTSVRTTPADYLNSIEAGIEGVRIGIDPGFAYEGVAPEIGSMLKAALETLERLGAKLVPVTFPGAGALVSDWMLLSSVELALAHEKTFPARRDEYGPTLSGFIEHGRTLSAIDYHRASLSRATFRGQLEHLFQDIDILAVPTQALAAPSLEMVARLANDPDALGTLAKFTCPFDLSGSPTLILPGGFTKRGLPMTFQLVGRHFEEALLFRAGVAFQSATTWHARHPDFANA